jgi:hypothetical protein
MFVFITVSDASIFVGTLAMPARIEVGSVTPADEFEVTCLIPAALDMALNKNLAVDIDFGLDVSVDESWRAAAMVIVGVVTTEDSPGNEPIN